MSKPSISPQEYADQLTRDGMHWHGDNGDNVVTYSFSSSLGVWWGNTGEYMLDEIQQDWVSRAFGQLSDLFDLTFVEVAEPANIATEYPLDVIQFVNDTNTGTYSSSYMYNDGGVAFNAIVFDDTWSSNQSSNLSYGSYGYMTMIHEILHSLGLEHPGNYNAGDGNGPITYENSAEFQQDTHRYSVMSYFNAQEDASGALHYDVMTGRFVYPSTLMVYDILAMSTGSFNGAFEGYSLNDDTRKTDTTYGYNATTGIDGALDFDVNTAPVVTLYDADGVDTLDLSDDTVSTKVIANFDANGVLVNYSTIARTETLIDLREGEYSSTHGMTFNIGIAFGTVIENAIGTQFSDTIHGNSANNTFHGGVGEDILNGYDGNDSLFGGFDNDRLTGGLGVDRIFGEGGIDTSVHAGLLSDGDVVRFDDIVMVFSDDPTDRDWLEAVEYLEFDDATLSSDQVASNDANSYLASHQDLLTAFGSDQDAAISHYFNNGHQEGRATDTFDEWSYLASYGDLLNVFGNNGEAATAHYVGYGYAEGRATDIFDEWSYLASYGDLLNAFGDNGEVATAHYVGYGYAEGRAIDIFDEWSYLASNEDLLNAYGSDGQAATYHYVHFGHNEARALDTFNADQYLANYADLQAAFGNDTALATYHYVEWGYAEGRTDDLLA